MGCDARALLRRLVFPLAAETEVDLGSRAHWRRTRSGPAARCSQRALRARLSSDRLGLAGEKPRAARRICRTSPSSRLRAITPGHHRATLMARRANRNQSGSDHPECRWASPPPISQVTPYWVTRCGPSLRSSHQQEDGDEASFGAGRDRDEQFARTGGLGGSLKAPVGHARCGPLGALVTVAVALGVGPGLGDAGCLDRRWPDCRTWTAHARDRHWCSADDDGHEDGAGTCRKEDAQKARQLSGPRRSSVLCPVVPRPPAISRSNS